MVRRTRHAAYEIRYHFVWVPKYRRNVLVGDIPQRPTVLLQEKAQEMGGKIIDLAIQPDHGHLFGLFRPTLAPHQNMHGLKGYPAFTLRNEFPHRKSRLPNMWTRSYYVSTAGNVSAQTIQRYIDEQKGR